MAQIANEHREFMANVAHELKTPIGAMALLAEALAAELDDSRRRALTRRLCDEARRAGTIVDDLMALGSDGRNARRSTLTPASQLAKDALERLTAAAELREVSIRIACTTDASVKAEPAEAVSALYHLVENALEHSEAGSQIEIDVTLGSDQRCRFAVTDQGEGLDPGEIDLIFERFFRGNWTAERMTSGTGLGLAIAKQSAQRNGGDIEVQSRLGEGSTFTLILQGEK